MFTLKYFCRTIALVVAVFAFAAYAAAASGTFKTIDYPDAVHTFALGNNPAGDIVGAYEDSAEVQHGFLLRNGVYSSFDYPGALWTNAYGINSRGDIVGQYGWFDGVDYIVRGFLSRKGEFYPIDIEGHQNTMPFKISPNGTIVGCLHDNATFLATMVGFELSSKGAVGKTSVRSMYTGINPAGDLVGYYFGTPSGTPLGRAAWSYTIIDGVMSWFQYPEAWVTLATDISPNGTIVGRYRMTSTSPVYGFIFIDGQFESFDVPGATTTLPFGVNAKGDIVGYYDDATGTHGFLRR